MMSAPFMANFMLPVPLASVPAVEMCWLQGSKGTGEKRPGGHMLATNGNSQGSMQFRMLHMLAICACHVHAASPCHLPANTGVCTGRLPMHAALMTTDLSSVPGMMHSARDTL